MATYTITLNERSAKGKALVEYLKALGVLMHKVSPNFSPACIRARERVLRTQVHKRVPLCIFLVWK